MLRFHAIGRFSPAHVLVRTVPDAHPRFPEIETAIDLAWKQALAQPNVKLFDGPMSRLESFSARDGILELNLSTTSYRQFCGTNLMHPEFAQRFGWAALANSVGASCALQSADGWLLMGRRNNTVAYYPRRIHPFAGALEPHQPMDVFADARRELWEELSLPAEAIAEMWCLGLVEDISLRQPELIFSVKSNRSRAEIEKNLNAAEHSAVMAIAGDTPGIDALLKDGQLTPVCIASLLLWGWQQWGDAWLAERREKFL